MASVDSFIKEGTAGKLTINANSIRLNSEAVLSAGTSSNKVDFQGEQAAININSKDLIIRRGSNIFTNARGENVVGGNINIDTNFRRCKRKQRHQRQLQKLPWRKCTNRY